jgi:hypothetical protein
LTRKSSWIIGPVNPSVKLRARRKFHPGNRKRAGNSISAWTVLHRHYVSAPPGPYSGLIYHFHELTP